MLYLYFIVTDGADCWMELTEAGKEDFIYIHACLQHVPMAPLEQQPRT